MSDACTAYLFPSSSLIAARGVSERDTKRPAASMIRLVSAKRLQQHANAILSDTGVAFVQACVASFYGFKAP